LKHLNKLLLVCLLQIQFVFSDDAEKIELLYKNIAALEKEIIVLRNLVEENSYLFERLQELNQQRYLEIDKRIYKLSSSKNNTDLNSINIETNLENEETFNTDLVLFKEALELFEGALYAEALDRFRKLIISSPEGEYTPDAYFWSGELFLAQKMLEDARESYLIIVDKYPDHKRAPDSFYKLGEISVSLGDNLAAVEYFKYVVNSYPDSAVAQLAKKSLENIQEESNLID
jgi:tol-pal system protein YbgF